VLRYWEDMSETDVAELLGCSVGTVKSTAFRGLARLRESMAAAGSAAVTPPKPKPERNASSC
jgi:DNA-directed RNA polymerase specialized sigma24 family protein